MVDRVCNFDYGHAHEHHTGSNAEKCSPSRCPANVHVSNLGHFYVHPWVPFPLHQHLDGLIAR